MHEINFYIHRWIVEGTKYKRRHFVGSENRLFPTKKYIIFEDLIDSITKKNKINKSDVVLCENYESIEVFWQTYFKQNIELYLHNKILGDTLNNLEFHDIKTPLIVSYLSYNRDFVSVVNFYNGEIHCFLSLIGEYSKKNYEHLKYNSVTQRQIDDEKKIKILTYDIQKQLYDKKEMNVKIRYGKKNYFFKLFFHPTTMSGNKFINKKNFYKSIGLDDLKLVNCNIRIRNNTSEWVNQNSIKNRFEMAYDKTLFDERPHPTKKFRWLEPLSRIRPRY